MPVTYYGLVLLYCNLNINSREFVGLRLRFCTSTKLILSLSVLPTWVALLPPNVPTGCAITKRVGLSYNLKVFISGLRLSFNPMLAPYYSSIPEELYTSTPAIHLVYSLVYADTIKRLSLLIPPTHESMFGNYQFYCCPPTFPFLKWTNSFSFIVANQPSAHKSDFTFGFYWLAPEIERYFRYFSSSSLDYSDNGLV